MKTCNECKCLFIDEEYQNAVREKTGEIFPHICMKFGKRVTHYPYEHPMIHPCEECEKGGEQK